MAADACLFRAIPEPTVRPDKVKRGEKGRSLSLIHIFFAYNDEDDRYTRTQESFCERAYTDEEIRGFIEKSGMKLLETYAGDSFEPIQPDTQRIVYVAQKI